MGLPYWVVCCISTSLQARPLLVPCRTCSAPSTLQEGPVHVQQQQASGERGCSAHSSALMLLEMTLSSGTTREEDVKNTLQCFSSPACLPWALRYVLAVISSLLKLEKFILFHSWDNVESQGIGLKDLSFPFQNTLTPTCVKGIIRCSQKSCAILWISNWRILFNMQKLNLV